MRFLSHSTIISASPTAPPHPNLTTSSLLHGLKKIEKERVTDLNGIEIREVEANLKQHEDLALQASLYKYVPNSYFAAKKEAEECRQKLTDLLNYAKSIARLTPNLEKEFLEMPTTIEELEAAIQDTTSQANSILFVYRNILEQYEDRQRQIEDLATKLDADKKESRRLLAELDNVKVRLPVRLAWYHLS
ncbi:hypothetical protein P8452_39503 [Trifolium repens]|nr:hypothetical protein P8452_39503 [Trifolium repens]